MQCETCGHQMAVEAAFCTSCGAPGGRYHLLPDEYIAPGDREAMGKLQSAGELNRVIQGFVTRYGKPWLESTFLGNGVKIGPGQFPLLYEVACELGEIFCMRRLPDIYAVNMMLTPLAIARANRAATLGTDQEAFVVLDARFLMGFRNPKMTLEDVRKDPVYYMLAREFSHVALGHALYLALVLWMSVSGPTGITGLVTRPLMVPLIYWARQAAFSADRGALVATGRYEEYRESLLTLLLGAPVLVKSLNVEAYLEQLARQSESASKFGEALTHSSPYISRRIVALDAYVKEPSYAQLRERVDRFIRRKDRE